jgi:hypothetical protein
LNVGVETIVALSGEGRIAAWEGEDRLLSILVQFLRRRDAFARRFSPLLS